MTVAKTQICNGMVYVGHVGGNSLDACVIDPALPVAAAANGAVGLPYWPSFRALRPDQRRAYLDWLASGRQTPDIDIGYAFLFFYGLERRLLLEAPDAQEVAALAVELQRLRDLYATNNSFNGYSRQLLDAVALLGTEGKFLPAHPDDAGREMPPTVKIAIAREVVAGRPLGFDLAAAGLLGLDAFSSVHSNVLDAGRGPFLAVLRPRFEAEYPGGFRLRDHKNSHLRLSYRGATAGLSLDLADRIGLERLPDPANLNWSKLITFAGTVAEEIDPYLRERLWHPARADSLAGLRTCPPELRTNTACEARRWIEALPPLAAVPFGELAHQAIGETSAKWTLRHHRLVAEGLAQVGRAMEPDPGDGSERLQDDTVVQVFPWSGGIIRSAAFETAATAALFVAASAGDNLEKGKEAWLTRLPERLPLSEKERQRLRARLAWLRGRKINLTKARRCLAQADDAQRGLCAWSAVIAVAAKGNIAPADVARLERIHDALGVPRVVLYSELHAGLGAAQAPADEPVAVASAEPEPLHPIPRRLPGGLDPRRLAEIRAETERSSAMLTEVFSDDEEPPSEEAGPAESAGPWAGLGAEYAALATRLLGRPEWPREAFESLAKESGLMPDGALEAINEWAFDLFDEPLVEDGDPIVVNAALLQKPSDGSEAMA